jgi:hypothetical protein
MEGEKRANEIPALHAPDSARTTPNASTMGAASAGVKVFLLLFLQKKKTLLS